MQLLNNPNQNEYKMIIFIIKENYILFSSNTPSFGATEYTVCIFTVG